MLCVSPRVVMYACKAHEIWHGTLVQAVAAHAGKRGGTAAGPGQCYRVPSTDWPERELRPCASRVAQAPC